MSDVIKTDALVQFARVLGELRAHGVSEELYAFLGESAGMSMGAVDAVLERADRLYGRMKGGTVELLGSTAVDSGQLMICDPCYVDTEWSNVEFEDVRLYDVATDEGVKRIQYRVDFDHYEQPLSDFGGRTVNQLVDEKKATKVPVKSGQGFNYNDIARLTSDKDGGQLMGRNGFPVAVASTTRGDGLYPVTVTMDSDGYPLQLTVDLDEV
ncbi:hypothetical protein A3709_18910 [Halioglobus sp. HI00S01]|uniref:hypothetical protein n=1 Tax=Halioglobus sp. HI00S01 TaxID=1822214 RepID=UPI0007C23D12|nr:hypothetical protein [Halioglobus sp. HI00S01]KZX57695.1 hypothetical protein A3709_18910 [Halioglobus sp. HI00S01]